MLLCKQAVEAEVGSNVYEGSGALLENAADEGIERRLREVPEHILRHVIEQAFRRTRCIHLEWNARDFDVLLSSCGTEERVQHAQYIHFGPPVDIHGERKAAYCMP